MIPHIPSLAVASEFCLCGGSSCIPRLLWSTQVLQKSTVLGAVNSCCGWTCFSHSGDCHGNAPGT